MAARIFSKTPFASNILRHSLRSVTRSRTLLNRFASTTVPGQGNPEIIENLPNTANEKLNGEKNGTSSKPDLGDLATGDGSKADWSRSFFGLSAEPFPKHVADVLQAPIEPLDVEIKPDGLLYLPEIKYRRILNKAFGPGGWGLAPRTETNVGPKVVSREYALVCLGRLVAVARGEQDFFDPNNISMATEGCKSNALTRCCKDLGIASELWDPRFIREFKSKHCVEVFVEHATNKSKKKLWRRRDQPKFEYPWKESPSRS